MEKEEKLVNLKKLIKPLAEYFLMGTLVLNAFLVLKSNMSSSFILSPTQAWQMVKANLFSEEFYLQLLIWPYVVGKFLIDLILGKVG